MTRIYTRTRSTRARPHASSYNTESVFFLFSFPRACSILGEQIFSWHIVCIRTYRYHYTQPRVGGGPLTAPNPWPPGIITLYYCSAIVRLQWTSLSLSAPMLFYIPVKRYTASYIRYMRRKYRNVLSAVGYRDVLLKKTFFLRNLISSFVLWCTHKERSFKNATPKRFKMGHNVWCIDQDTAHWV